MGRVARGLVALVFVALTFTMFERTPTAQAATAAPSRCLLRPALQLAPTDPPSPAAQPNHCTILSIGDSVGLDLGIGLAREFAHQPGVSFISRGVVSTGLVHNTFYNWPQHLTDYLSRWHPDVVVVCVGANDHSSITVNGRSVPLLTLPWQAAYQVRIRQIADIVRNYGAQIVWVGVPVSSTGGYRQAMKAMNSIYKGVMASTPGGFYIDSWNLFASSTGAVRPTAKVNSRAMQVRSLDLIHYTPAGCDVFATYVIRAIAAQYNVILKPSAPAFIAG
ncbi:MAG: GDSL-type esterase/lipase family protein [Actinomycetes bacterium]